MKSVSRSSLVVTVSRLLIVFNGIESVFSVFPAETKTSDFNAFICFVVAFIDDSRPCALSTRWILMFSLRGKERKDTSGGKRSAC